MRHSIIIAAALVAAAPTVAHAQATPTSAAVPADARSMDAIVAALYAVISGDAGAKRDWGRFRALFHPSARLIAARRGEGGKAGTVRVTTPDDYVAASGPVLERDGFHEREIGRRVERYGAIAHLFSTYDSKRKVSDPQPFMRGINSIQLLDDGSRWWILSVAWSAETPATPIPAEYLR